MKYNEELRNTIYDLMNGALDLEHFEVPESKFAEDEFAEGKLCNQLYEDFYYANRRVCERLGVDEDEDVETIIRSLMEINEICAKKMFEYGALTQSISE